MSIASPARLVAPTPDCPYQRLALFGLRRMAAGGIGDAHAAHAFLVGFGISFRRPLLLMRAFMNELARAARQTIAVAPCCCPRVTQAENAILSALTLAAGDPAGAHAYLAELLGVADCAAVTENARAVAAGFADCGMPLNEIA